MCFTKSIPTYSKDIHRIVSTRWSSTQKLVFVSLMGTIATIFQAAGGLLPGIGYFISPLTTAPILLAMLISFRLGLLSYLITIALLFLIEPSELFIFPFTTGLLGLGLGWSFRFFNRRLGILLLSGVILFIGICIPLYMIGLPVFGPIVSSPFDMKVLLIIFGFSLLYSWLWLELGLIFFRRIKLIIY